MKLVSIKTSLSLAWLVAVGLAGIAVDLDSPVKWVLLFGVALVPSIVMMSWWKDPAPATSEAIHEARP